MCVFFIPSRCCLVPFSSNCILSWFFGEICVKVCCLAPQLGKWEYSFMSQCQKPKQVKKTKNIVCLCMQHFQVSTFYFYFHSSLSRFCGSLFSSGVFPLSLSRISRASHICLWSILFGLKFKVITFLISVSAKVSFSK